MGMDGTNRTEQIVNERYVDSLGACELIGLRVLNPSHAIRYYRRTAGFPRGVRLGRSLQWKASEVLAWRENQHAMSK